MRFSSSLPNSKRIKISKELRIQLNTKTGDTIRGKTGPTTTYEYDLKLVG